MNDYFAARTVVTDQGCWEWNLSRSRAGYGQAVMRSRYNRPVGAHRLAYELLVGPIPAGMTVDHLCFNPPCVNPAHLRLLSRSENCANQRDAHKTHCINGHEYAPANIRKATYAGNGRRGCKTCHRDRERARRVAAAMDRHPAGKAIPEVPQTADIQDYLRQKGEIQ